jgi:hypothetical protein
LTTVPGMGTANLAATGSRAHLLFYDNRDGNFEMYYKRNLTAGGMEEREKSEVRRVKGGATVIRRVLFLDSTLDTRSSSLLDASGRRVMPLHPGPNDVSSLAPGVYFIGGSSTVTKVVIQR